MASRVLLGHQRYEPVVRQALDQLDISTGTIGMITAGWQERELQDGELRDELQQDSVNLEVYARGRRAFERAPELFAAHRAKQDRIKILQKTYAIHIDALMEGLARIDAFTRDAAGAVEEEIEETYELLRVLDAKHAEKIARIEAQFVEEHKPWEHPAVAKERDELIELIARCDALTIAGGHVAVLLNRVNVLGLADVIAAKDVVAWSAGAMLLAERIVLFHDHPAQGFGHAQVLANGLGLFPDVIPLPHASTRLNLSDVRRVSMLSRRMLPYVCAPLERKMWLEYVDGAWSSRGGTFLSEGGENLPWPPNAQG